MKMGKVEIQGNMNDTADDKVNTRPPIDWQT